MTDPAFPERPLDRFLDLFDALMQGKSLFEDAHSLRFCASTLVTLPGPPRQVARELRAAADVLKQDAGWFGPLQSTVRYVVAAMLLRSERDARSFSAGVERMGELFKQHGLRRDGIHAILAMLLLQEYGQASGRAAGSDQVRRMAEIHRAMSLHHRLLTGRDDYPACALLVDQRGSPREIADRCEVFYDGLRDVGFRRGEALQTVSHLLTYAPGDDRTLMQRFRRLFELFDGSGLWMHAGDYDEVAALAILEREPAETVGKVLEHRAVLAAHKPKPGKELSFSLACSTAFLELARDDPAAQRLHGAQNALTLQAILQAQQAAMIAAASGAAAAGASS